MNLALWVNAGAAVALVIVTFLYVRLTHRLVAEQRRQNNLFARPFMQARVSREDRKESVHKQVLYLHVENVGRTPALTVHVKLDATSARHKYGGALSDLDVFLRPHSIWAPGQRFTVPFLFTQDGYHSPGTAGLTVRLEYTDPAGSSLRDSFVFGPGLLRSMATAGEAEPA